MMTCSLSLSLPLSLPLPVPVPVPVPSPVPSLCWCVLQTSNQRFRSFLFRYPYSTGQWVASLQENAQARVFQFFDEKKMGPTRHSEIDQNAATQGNRARQLLWPEYGPPRRG
jgi:hypothetical protein